MTPEECIKKLDSCGALLDPELAHIDAEQILCEFLTSIGHSEVADKFNEIADNMPFWYA